MEDNNTYEPRFQAIEESLIKQDRIMDNHGKALAYIQVTQHGMREILDEVKTALSGINQNNQKAARWEKGIVGLLAVQSLLSGVGAPEMAHRFIEHLLSQGGQP